MVHRCDLLSGFFSVELMSSLQPHTREVLKDSSITWTWALNAPESCWCLECSWPKRWWRSLSLTVVQKVQTHTLFGIFEAVKHCVSVNCEVVLLCLVCLSLKGGGVLWWQARLDRTGLFCITAQSTQELMQKGWVLKWVSLSCSNRLQQEEFSKGDK